MKSSEVKNRRKRSIMRATLGLRARTSRSAGKACRAGCGPPGKEAAMALTISSPSFSSGGEIPSVHTCDGKDVSPELRFGDVPEGTKTLVLIVHDPDAPDPKAPRMDWVHWVVYNLPASTRSLPQGEREADLPAGALAPLAHEQGRLALRITLLFAAPARLGARGLGRGPLRGRGRGRGRGPLRGRRPLRHRAQQGVESRRLQRFLQYTLAELLPH